jgi:hypothetical protein
VSGLRFWHWTGLLGKGYVSYAPGVMESEGPFGNPARMIEDIMGGSTDHSEFVNGDCESDFNARVWGHAGWWDMPMRKGPR